MEVFAELTRINNGWRCRRNRKKRCYEIVDNKTGKVIGTGSTDTKAVEDADRQVNKITKVGR